MATQSKKTAEIQASETQDAPSETANARDAAGQARQQARKVLDRLPILGPVVWLYAHSPFHKHAFMVDVEWMVMPPLVLDQAKLYMKDSAPMAFASWAYLGDKAEKRLLSGETRLAPTDWNSGNRLWLIDLVAPFGSAKDIIKDVRENLFPTQDIKYLVPDFEKKGVRPVVWRAFQPTTQ